MEPQASNRNHHFASWLREGWDPARTNAVVDLVALVARVAYCVRGFARTRAVDVRAARPAAELLVRCDPQAAEQVLTNLVFLAVASAPVGGLIEVSVESTGDRFSVQMVQQATVSPAADDWESATRIEPPPAKEEALGLAVAMEICKLCGWFLALEWHGGRSLDVTIEGRLAATGEDSRTPPSPDGVRGASNE